MAAAPPASRRVVFVTSKYWKATSKVGFHFLAQSFARAGWDVLVIQYTYCRLAILAPSFLRSPRPNFVLYIPGDRASIGSALEEARRFDRGRVDTAGIRSWDDLADQLGRGAAPRRT